jgi:hypothetical protein
MRSRFGALVEADHILQGVDRKNDRLQLAALRDKDRVALRVIQKFSEVPACLSGSDV